MSAIKLHHWDYDLKKTIEDGEVFTNDIARCVTEENFIELFDDLMNYGGRGFTEGIAVAEGFKRKHPTIQRSAIAFCLGFVVRMADSQFVDARNETAVETAKKIQALADEGELPIGIYL